MSANYGDCALGLGPQWNRNIYEYPEQMQATVGHNDGIADCYRTEHPEQEHQFRWVDHLGRGAAQEISALRQKGYEFVKQNDWTKVDYLWEWDAEGYCIFMGQRLMARPKSKFLEDQARRDGIHAKARVGRQFVYVHAAGGLEARGIVGLAGLVVEHCDA